MTAIDEFRNLLGSGAVLSSEGDMASYAVDWKKSFRGLPAFVILPRSAEQVSAAVRLAFQEGLTIVPQGGNTGLAAGATPDETGRQIVLALSRMNSVRKVDTVGMTLEVEAGCILKTAQDAAAAVDRMLPVSFGAEGSAQIGGVIATNAGGINVLKFGMARQLVLGLEVVRPDGSVLSGLRHLRKDNAGYDWKHLFIGSEGTLGVITAAILRLVPRPKHVVTALMAIPDAHSVLALLKFMQDELGDAISAFELISGDSLKLVAEHFELLSPIARVGWHVLLEASSSIGDLEDAVGRALMSALEEGIATDGVVAQSHSQAAQLWALRERIPEAEAKEQPSFKHDVSVPIPTLPCFLEEASDAIRKRYPATRLNVFGHVGDGNIHFNVIAAPDTDGGSVNRTMHDLVHAYGGSISAEHGIGAYRVEEYARYCSPTEMILSREIKRLLDPTELLNPGKIFARRSE